MSLGTFHAFSKLVPKKKSPFVVDDGVPRRIYQNSLKMAAFSLFCEEVE
jgi:hypothetical protein